MSSTDPSASRPPPLPSADDDSRLPPPPPSPRPAPLTLLDEPTFPPPAPTTTMRFPPPRHPQTQALQTLRTQGRRFYNEPTTTSRSPPPRRRPSLTDPFPYSPRNSSPLRRAPLRTPPGFDPPDAVQIQRRMGPTRAQKLKEWEAAVSTSSSSSSMGLEASQPELEVSPDIRTGMRVDYGRITREQRGGGGGRGHTGHHSGATTTTTTNGDDDDDHDQDGNDYKENRARTRMRDRGAAAGFEPSPIMEATFRLLQAQGQASSRPQPSTTLHPFQTYHHHHDDGGNDSCDITYKTFGAYRPGGIWDSRPPADGENSQQEGREYKKKDEYESEGEKEKKKTEAEWRKNVAW
ncbi:hypothetical protein QBC43DRAFT_289329 [Cladorrhinum sp. PSN259]|nr:hypothetical protein QBC43DRAFT_289329 [Cladorrhinum sp. PSN259]